jgi:hypothetical protein
MTGTPFLTTRCGSNKISRRLPCADPIGEMTQKSASEYQDAVGSAGASSTRRHLGGKLIETTRLRVEISRQLDECSTSLTN